MQKKRIAIHLPDLNLGGIGKNSFKLAEAFRDKGYKVEFVINNFNGKYIDQIPNDIAVVDLKSNRFFCSLPKIYKYLKQTEPDAFIVARDYINIPIIIIKNILRIKTRLMISCHTNMAEEVKYAGLKRKIFLKIILFLTRFTYRYADSVVVVSEGIKNDVHIYSGLDKDRITTIYNPIIDSKMEAQMKEEVECKWIEVDEKVIISVGRLTRQKDFVTLIKAFDLVKKQYEGVKLIILGEGEDRVKLQKLIDEMGLGKEVNLWGYVNNPYAYLKKADLFVLASAWEGFGNSIVEAMATGIPLICTDCPSGPSEILANGKYGDLVKVGDYEELSKRILYNLRNVNVLKETKEARVKRAYEFTLEEAANKYLHALKLGENENGK